MYLTLITFTSEDFLKQNEINAIYNKRFMLKKALKTFNKTQCIFMIKNSLQTRKKCSTCLKLFNRKV